MRKLEKIVRIKDRYRNKYDYNYGEGSFDRVNLSKFRKKPVNVFGTVVDFTIFSNKLPFFKAVIYDVNVSGETVDHLNIEVPTRFYLAILESYKKGIPIRFNAYVYPYKVGVRGTYGLKRVDNVRLKSKYESDLSSLEYYRDYSKDYRISEKLVMENFDKGVSLRDIVKSFSKNFRTRVLIKFFSDSLLSYYHSRYTKISKADDTLSKVYGRGNQLKKHNFFLLNKGKKRGIYSKYMSVSSLARFKHYFNKTNDLYKSGVKNIRLFLYDWVEDKESGFRDSIRYLPYTNDLSTYLSVPIVSQDVSKPDRYCIVYPSHGGVSADLVYKKFIEKVLKDFGISDGEVTYYDPYKNTYAVRKVSNGYLILSEEDKIKNKIILRSTDEKD